MPVSMEFLTSVKWYFASFLSVIFGLLRFLSVPIVWIFSISTRSDWPKVVFLCIITASPSQLLTITWIISWARLNKTWSALTWFSVLNRTCGSNTAANSIGGRFHHGMWAGMIIEWLAGTNTLPVATTQKTWLVWIKKILWFKRTQVSSFRRSFFFKF